MAASMPLHPASMETAKPLVVLCRILPVAATRGSKSVTRAALMRANPSVQGRTSPACTGGVNSSASKATRMTMKKMKKRAITARASSSDRGPTPLRPLA